MIRTLKLTGAPDAPESDVQAALIRRLCACGWVAVRINSGCTKTANGGFFRAYTIAGLVSSSGKNGRGGLASSSGFPDVLALKGDATGTRARLFEIKKRGGALGESQKRFIEFAGLRGVSVEIVEGFGDLEKLDLT